MADTDGSKTSLDNNQPLLQLVVSKINLFLTVKRELVYADLVSKSTLIELIELIFKAFHKLLLVYKSTTIFFFLAKFKIFKA